MALDDLARDGQAHAHALGLRREEGVEDARQVFLRNAATIVLELHGHPDLPLRFRRGAGRTANAENAALAVDGAGVDRVETQVEEHLLELVGRAAAEHRSRQLLLDPDPSVATGLKNERRLAKQ